MAEEAQTAAILFLPKDYLPISLCCVWMAYGGGLQIC
jgi:hypothetical protein